MSETTAKCPRCAGCGELANDEVGTPWTVLLGLRASASSLLGWHVPVLCPVCDGAGTVAA